MPTHVEITQAVDAAPEGSHIGAFFDFDGTLIAGYSIFEFFKEQVNRGQLSRTNMLETVSAASAFGIGNLSFTGLMTSSSNMMAGIDEDSYIEFSQRVYEKKIARLIYPEARALVQAHLDKRHTVAIVSSATIYHISPAARDMEIEHILCTRFEVKDGKFTGHLAKPICWAEGKLLAAEDLAATHDLDLDESFFYTDGDADLELLKRVGYPVPLNPNSKLVSIAEEQNWPVHHFKNRETPGIKDLVTSMAADLSQTYSFLASLPVRKRTTARTQAQNFAFSIFADLGSLFIGLNLKVKGEHYLREQRPVVFVFNHQSKADVMITAKLVRRNACLAIGSSDALVDLLQTQGKSLLIAPEGKRSLTRKLRAFKKRAFELAMRAGVPMVPIVIHNSNDVAPHGGFIYRQATVEVEVLPPIDTSDWRPETLDDHVTEVRDKFLKTLGQEDAEK